MGTGSSFISKKNEAHVSYCSGVMCILKYCDLKMSGSCITNQTWNRAILIPVKSVSNPQCYNPPSSPLAHFPAVQLTVHLCPLKRAPLRTWVSRLIAYTRLLQLRLEETGQWMGRVDAIVHLSFVLWINLCFVFNLVVFFFFSTPSSQFSRNMN